MFHRPEGSIIPMLFEVHFLAGQVEEDLKNPDLYDTAWARLWRCRAVSGLDRPFEVSPMMDGGLLVTVDSDLDAVRRLRALLDAIEEQLRLGNS
jgi:hypothetical protein